MSRGPGALRSGACSARAHGPASRRALASAALAGLLVACSGRPMPPPRDFGSPDRDQGPRDGGGDGPDMGQRDFGPPPDLGPDFGVRTSFEGWGAGVPEVCEAVNPDLGVGPLPCASPEECPNGGAGFVCIAGGCEGRYCEPAGIDCEGRPEICGDDATCQDGVCTPSFGVGDCADPRACPRDHFCQIEEGSGLGACRDRRLPCEDAGGCPTTHQCLLRINAGHAWCVPTMFECTIGGDDCQEGECLQVDPDEPPLCYPAEGDCDAHADCTGPGERCGVNVETGRRECNLFGPCTSSDQCAEGFACTDVHQVQPLGPRVCHPIPSDEPGSIECETDLECADNQLCFALDDDDNDGAVCVCFNPETSGLIDCAEL